MIEQTTKESLQQPRGKLTSMVAPRSIYFFYYAALATMAPYLALYYQSLGLSGTQIGVLTALPPAVGWIAGPAWGALADLTHQNKRILFLASAVTIGTVLMLSRANVFAILAIIIILNAFFMAPIIPLVDNSVVELLGGQSQEYGKQRVWGTYGWGIASLIGGWVIQKLGLPVMFYSFSLLFSFNMLAAIRFPVSQAPIAIKYGRSALKLLSNRRWLLFLGVVMILGAGMAMIGNYFAIYFASLGASTTWVGAAYAVATISEVPALFFSDRLIRRFGLLGLLVIGGTVFGVRAICFSFAVVPWQALALQLLHGLTYALVLVAGVEYASQLAPPGLGATAQGLFYGIFNGLGYALGALLGGILLDTSGIQGMYRIAGISALIAIGLFLVISSSWRRSEQKSSAGQSTS